MMIEKFVTILREAGLRDLAAVDIAEMILLASYLPAPQITEAEPGEATGEESPNDSQSAQTTGQQPPPADQQSRPGKADIQPRQGSLYDQTAGEMAVGEGIDVWPFRAPKADALPGARKIARVLRPLRRRHPSNRRSVLDEEGTVRQIADGGPQSAVVKPAPERWLDIALIFDASVTMRVWGQTLSELRRLFEQCGIFRDVRTWTLNTEGAKAKLYQPTADGVAKQTAQRQLRSPGELLDPLERRLIIVLSDCHSTAWHSGDAYRVIAKWAAKGPVALVQALPQRLWLGTTMTPVDAVLRAPKPAAANRLLQVAPQWYKGVIKQGGVAVPVVTLDEWSIGPWARMIAGASGVTTMGLVIPRLGDDAGASGQPVQPEFEERRGQSNLKELPAKNRIDQFFENASPQAKQLAYCLAAAPLSLPVMQLVQQTRLPQSRQSHLAEFFLSGLIYQPTGRWNEDQAPDEIIYEFYDGVRDELLDRVTEAEIVRVIYEVSRHIERRIAGAAGEFTALLDMPAEGAAVKRLDPLSLRFAQLSADILRQFGRYQESITKLERFLAVAAPEPRPKAAAGQRDIGETPHPAVQSTQVGSFGWLHLTDLHRGMREQGGLWPGVRERFFEDLRRLHESCGPWDVVLFTGDLTQRGSADEFTQVDELLDQLWELFATLGSAPALLAVPGNHDLVRPSGTEPAVLLLQQWNDRRDIPSAFWEQPDSPYRQVVTQAFANYRAWWEQQPRKAAGINPGLLPGDFSVSLAKGEARLGIVGLNTAFLQLTGADYTGKLALHVRQFHAACRGDGIAWAKQHHACLLLTHHPPAWLNAESQRHLAGEIADHGRFAVHLCGHLHETGYRVLAEGGTEAQCVWQGRSLFGLEFFGDQEQRSYGYTAGKIELRGERGSVRFWPREARLQGPPRDLVVDTSLTLPDKSHTRPRNFRLLQPFVRPSIRRSVRRPVIRRCVVIGDSDVPRWESVKHVVETLGGELWPPDDDFKTRLLDVDTWLPLICDRRSAILLDLQIGQSGYGAVVSRRDVEEIIERMKHHPLLPIEYAAFEKRLLRIPWQYQIAALVVNITKTRRVPIKCVTAFSAVDTKFLTNVGSMIDMISLQPDELTRFLRG